MDTQTGRLVIITGMSGAGKSTALRCFEDSGYCCLDNLPPTLIETFLKLFHEATPHNEDIAIVCDVRSGELFSSFSEAILDLAERRVPCDVLFLDCDDDILVNRFKEARRSPPLGIGLRIEEAVMLERQRMDPVKELATSVVDTSNLAPNQLRNRLLGMFSQESAAMSLSVTLLSFGFKYGIPADADFVFDARFLDNPYYVEELRTLTGEDEKVRDYVMATTEAREYLDNLLRLLNHVLPRYRNVHKTNATIALGCTGGKHRSVTFANLMHDKLSESGFYVTKQHRDIDRI